MSASADMSASTDISASTDTPVHSLNQSVILTNDNSTNPSISDESVGGVESDSITKTVKSKNEVDLYSIDSTDLELGEYSDKSFVIHGPATRLFTKELRELKAMFNPRLVKLDHGPGWVITKKLEEPLMEWYEKVKSGKLVPDIDEVKRHLAEKKAAREEMKAKSPQTGKGIAGIPTLNGKNEKGSFVMQTITYKVPALIAGHKLQLTVGEDTVNYVVESIGKCNGKVDTAIIHPIGDGKTLSKIVVFRSKWQIWGFNETHIIAIV